MEKKTPRPMTPFDELTTPYPLSMLKLLLPYIAPSNQRMLWIMVKFMELQYTVSILGRSGQSLSAQAFGRFPDSPLELLEEIAPYLPPELAQMADTFRNAMNMMEMMQMFQDISGNSGDSGGSDPDGSDSGGSNSGGFSGMNPMDLMMGMMAPEQQEMFRMYQDMFANNENDAENESETNSKTGDDMYERMDEQPASEGYGSGETGTDQNGVGADDR